MRLCGGGDNLASNPEIDEENTGQQEAGRGGSTAMRRVPKGGEGDCTVV